MKKLISPILIGIALIGSLSISTIEVEANTKAKPKTYSNCKELNQIYPGGVAKNAQVKNQGGKTKYKPFVSAQVYKLNSKSDRDKDGIACER